MAITRTPHVYDPEVSRWVPGSFTETSYAGLVLKVFSEDYRAMSDVYTIATWALVWCTEFAQPKRVLVNANFECDVGGGQAQVDATPEVLAMYRAWEAEQERLRRIAEDKAQKARELLEKNRPEKGKRMVVVSGRKVPKGTVGTVAFVRDGAALLKDDATWQDRNANGVWVASRHLAARD